MDALARWQSRVASRFEYASDGLYRPGTSSAVVCSRVKTKVAWSDAFVDRDSAVSYDPRS